MLLKESLEMCGLLTSRLTNLRAVRSMWTMKVLHSLTWLLLLLLQCFDSSKIWVFIFVDLNEYIFYFKGSVMSALEVLTRINDPSVLHDLINRDILSVVESKLHFDECLMLLPLLKTLLQNEEIEEYVKKREIFIACSSSILIDVCFFEVMWLLRWSCWKKWFMCSALLWRHAKCSTTMSKMARCTQFHYATNFDS